MIVKDMLEAEGRLRCLHLLLLTSSSVYIFVARELGEQVFVLVDVGRGMCPDTCQRMSCTHYNWYTLAVPDLAAFFQQFMIQYDTVVCYLPFILNSYHQSSCPPLKIHFVHAVSSWVSTAHGLRFLVWIVHAALNQATQKSTATLVVEAWRKVYRPMVHVAWPNRATKGEDWVKQWYMVVPAGPAQQVATHKTPNIVQHCWCSDNTNLTEIAWGCFVWDYERVNCCEFFGKNCDLRTVLPRPTAVVFAAYWAMIMIAPCIGRSPPKWPVWLVEWSIPRIRMTRLIWYFYHIQHIQVPYLAFGGRAMEVMAGRHHGGCILLHHLCHFSYL